MQGKKQLQPKMLYTVTLEQLVPSDNFYRRLNKALNLHWLYGSTKGYYGSEGQESIDPVVFFKMCMVGYINNIGSDRKLADHCSDSLGIRLFLGYDIDEPLPWHSTISRTRQLYGEEVFKQLFEQVFEKCIASGMIAGHTQAIDGALLKANASKDSLEIKQVSKSVATYLLENIKANTTPRRPAKHNRADDDQQHMDGDEEQQTRQLKELDTRYQRQGKAYEEMPGSDRGKYLSNRTHYSPTDPDARIAVKPGKPRELYYSGQIAVDTAHHVITHAGSFTADEKDCRDLITITQQLQTRLNGYGIQIEKLLADGAYSSGENYQYLEKTGITPYIPLLGGALSGSEGFIYDEAKDWYICRNNKLLKGSGRVVDDGRGHPVRKYFSLQSDCKNCPIRKSCITDKAKTKKIQHSIYKAELERAKARQQTVKAKVMKRKRSSTVEPVWGTLINFTGMKRLNARGLKAANKMLLLSATVYNLKKWLRFTAPQTTIKTMALLKTKTGQGFSLIKSHLQHLILKPIEAMQILLSPICF
ncbi:MAG TPA: IS1182 family transposase [Chitinophagaceae bacterium]|nr:IS1182 family transposase [Chitinophagaceae bacterium]